MTPAIQKLAVEARKRKAAERRELKAKTFVLPASKVCKDCGKSKPIEDFPKNPSMLDGHLNNCRTCENARIEAYRVIHPRPRKPKIIKQTMTPAQIRRRHYDKNKKTLLAKRKAFRLKNIEREKARERKYLQNNRTVVRAKNGRRRAAETRAVPPWLNAIQKAQIQEFYEIAAARTVQTGVKHHVDHIVPLRGDGICGLHVAWNLQVLTEFENCSKHNKLIEAVE